MLLSLYSCLLHTYTTEQCKFNNNGTSLIHNVNIHYFVIVYTLYSADINSGVHNFQ